MPTPDPTTSTGALTSTDFGPPDLLGSYEGQRQRAAVLAGLFGEPEVRPTIDRFTLLRKLGAGGMGVVYAAYDPRLDRTIALKLLRGREGEPAPLLREAKLLAQLAHPNVVTVFDVGEIDGRVYLAMEYVAGETLRAWLQARRRPWRETLAPLLQAGRGLAAAHAAGLVHRDFKPDNAIVDAEGRARVLDFGLAAAEANATATLGGTPGYMAPELRAGRCDARSDQYSYCVTLFEALHGSRPDVAGPRRHDLPRWLEQAIERGLQADPAARWPSLAELLAELEAGPRRRRRACQATGLAALLAASFAASWLVQRGELAACSGIAGLAAEVWGDPQRAAVDQAMRATGMPAAAQAFAALDRSLTDHVAAWTTTYEAACAAHQRGELSESTYAKTTACLLDARAGARALVTALAADGKPAVQRAGQVVGSLARPDACLGSEAAVAVLVPASAAPEVVLVRDELAAARTEALLHRHDNARRHAHAAMAAAQRVATPVLIAEATLGLGAVEIHARRFAAGERLMTQAYFRALAADSALLARKAAMNLVALVGYQRRDFKRVEYWDQTLLAFAERFAGDREFVAGVDHNRGMLLAAQDRFAEARECYDRALAWHEEHGTPDSVARVVDLRAHAREVLGDSDGAVADLRRALKLREDHFGPEHPSLVTSLNNLGIVLTRRGELPEAREVLERAIALGPADAVPSLNNLVDVLILLEDHVAAITTARRSLALAEATAKDEYRTTNARLALGRALVHVGQSDEALPLLRRALQERRDRLGVRHRDAANAAHELARALSLRATLADLAEAESLLREALSVYPPGDRDARKAEDDLATFAALRAKLATPRER